MIVRWLTDIDKWLIGWPNVALTVVLLLLALVIVIIALRGSPKVKAATFGWVVFP